MRKVIKKWKKILKYTSTLFLIKQKKKSKIKKSYIKDNDLEVYTRYSGKFVRVSTLFFRMYLIFKPTSLHAQTNPSTGCYFGTINKHPGKQYPSIIFSLLLGGNDLCVKGGGEEQNAYFTSFLQASQKSLGEESYKGGGHPAIFLSAVLRLHLWIFFKNFRL